MTSEFRDGGVSPGCSADKTAPAEALGHIQESQEQKRSCVAGVSKAGGDLGGGQGPEQSELGFHAEQGGAHLKSQHSGEFEANLATLYQKTGGKTKEKGKLWLCE